MAEERFSEEESLQLIRAMINKAKGRFTENGFLYLMWGWVVFICAFSQFIMMKFFQVPYEALWYVWMLTWVAFIFQVFYVRKKRRSQKVKTYTDDILGFVWLVFVVSLILILVIVGKFRQPELINPLVLVIYGMPTFLSGIILRFKPLVMGGIICWLLSLLCSIAPVVYQILFLAAAVLSAWIIPGFILRNKFRKQEHVQRP